MALAAQKKAQGRLSLSLGRGCRRSSPAYYWALGCFSWKICLLAAFSCRLSCLCSALVIWPPSWAASARSSMADLPVVPVQCLGLGLGEFSALEALPDPLALVVESLVDLRTAGMVQSPSFPAEGCRLPACPRSVNLPPIL